jgi:hypothetical protein
VDPAVLNDSTGGPLGLELGADIRELVSRGGDNRDERLPDKASLAVSSSIAVEELMSTECGDFTEARSCSDFEEDSFFPTPLPCPLGIEPTELD